VTTCVPTPNPRTAIEAVPVYAVSPSVTEAVPTTVSPSLNVIVPTRSTMPSGYRLTVAV
jgi:hypothetical protein